MVNAPVPESPATGNRIPIPKTMVDLHPAPFVELPNYDTRILPASGVLDAAVYWQLVEWATADLK